MNEVTGKIQQVSQKEGKYGIKVGDIWYNGFGIAPGSEGDEVTFDFENSANGAWHNIRAVKNLYKGVGTSQSKFNGNGNGEHHKQIMESAKLKRRAQMMQCAVDVCLANKKFDTDTIKDFYGKFMTTIGEDPDENLLESQNARPMDTTKEKSDS